MECHKERERSGPGPCYSAGLREQRFGDRADESGPLPGEEAEVQQEQ